MDDMNGRLSCAHRSPSSVAWIVVGYHVCVQRCLWLLVIIDACGVSPHAPENEINKVKPESMRAGHHESTIL